MGRVCYGFAVGIEDGNEEEDGRLRGWRADRADDRKMSQGDWMWVRERSQMSCYYGGNNDDNELRRDEGGRKMKTH
jgi:hypothetical protein